MLLILSSLPLLLILLLLIVLLVFLLHKSNSRLINTRNKTNIIDPGSIRSLYINFCYLIIKKKILQYMLVHNLYSWIHKMIFIIIDYNNNNNNNTFILKNQTSEIKVVRINWEMWFHIYAEFMLIQWNWNENKSEQDWSQVTTTTTVLPHVFLVQLVTRIIIVVLFKNICIHWHEVSSLLCCLAGTVSETDLTRSEEVWLLRQGERPTPVCDVIDLRPITAGLVQSDCCFVLFQDGSGSVLREDLKSVFTDLFPSLNK